jgi:hypothetical protein
MWEALIELVKKWSYRCNHEFELIEESEVLDREMYNRGIRIAASTSKIYFCAKCGVSKKVTN